MTATKFSVALDGAVHTRTSQSRAYTHVLVGRRNQAAERAYAYGYQGDKTLRSNYRYDCFIAAQQAGVPARYEGSSTGYTFTYTQDAIDRVKAHVGDCPTYADYVAKERAKLIARHEKSAACPDAYKLVALGWSSRADLAWKQASQHKSLIDIAVLPCAAEVIVPKKTDAKSVNATARGVLTRRIKRIQEARSWNAERGNTDAVASNDQYIAKAQAELAALLAQKEG